MEDTCKNISAGGDKPSVFSKSKTEKCNTPVLSNGIENNGLYGYTDCATIFDNSITISARGTIGFCCKRIEPYLPIVRLLSVIPLSWVDIDYLLIVLSSFTNIAEGSSIPQLTVPSLSNIIIPLPPLNEQKRIAKVVSRLQTAIQEIDFSEEKIKILLTNTKSKILELAMQGKLVPQDPADEPAADMLLRINPKARIITDNPHSRNIPNGWCISTVKDLCIFLSRGKSPKYADSPNQYPVFAQKCNLKDGGVSLEQARFLDESTLDKWPEKYRLRSGDVLINSTGTGTVGRTRLFSDSVLGDYPFTVPDSHVSVVRSYDEINSTYLFYYLFSSTIQEYFEDNLAGSTNQKELYIDVIGNTEVLLPPINEQKRIVAKIEELYAVLDEIEASLQS